MAIGISSNVAQAALMGQNPEEDLSVIPSQQQFAQDLNMMGATPNLKGPLDIDPLPPLANVTQPTEQPEVTQPAVAAQPMGQLPEGVQPGSPQATFLAERARGGLNQARVKQAEQFAASMGTTFDPETGYSREPFLQAQEQQAQSDASRQASLMGRPMEGQSYAQFMRYEDQPIQRTEQFVDPQGRIRRRATEAAVELMRQDGFDVPQGVQPLAPEYAGYEQEAAMPRQLMDARPDFMEAQPVSSRAGQIYTDAQLRDITGGGEAFQRAKALQDAGIDPFTGKRPEAVDPLDRRLKELEIAQAAKELAGEPVVEGQIFTEGGRSFIRHPDGTIKEVSEPTAARPSASEQKISTIMEANPGISFTEAANIASGVVKVISDPVTGRTNLVNVVEGTSTPMRTPAEVTEVISTSLKPEEGEPEYSIKLYDIAEETTGIAPAIAALAQRFTGQRPIGVDVADPELLENIQTFQTAQSRIRRSLRTAPKFLASEMDMLSKEIDISPGPLKDPTTLLAQLRSVDNSIRVRLQDIAEKTDDPSLPAEDVRGARSLQKDLTNFLRILGVPQDEQTTDASPAPTGSVEDIASKYL